MNIGDRVKVLRVPEGLPVDNKQLRTLFHGCVGKTFSVVAFDGDLVELHVGEAFDRPAEYHQIWIDPTYLKKVEA